MNFKPTHDSMYAAQSGGSAAMCKVDSGSQTIRVCAAKAIITSYVEALLESTSSVLYLVAVPLRAGLVNSISALEIVPSYGNAEG